MRNKVLVFASGGKKEYQGGSGFWNLVVCSRECGNERLHADIVGVVSQYADGGVSDLARTMNVPFYHITEFSIESYQSLMKESGADYYVLSGYTRKVVGLPANLGINIHPALLSVSNGKYGGNGKWGDQVHMDVFKDYERGKITDSGLTIHFVGEEYDKAPIIGEHKVSLLGCESFLDVKNRVRAAEKSRQSFITNLFVTGRITWDGNAKSPIRYI